MHNLLARTLNASELTVHSSLRVLATLQFGLCAAIEGAEHVSRSEALGAASRIVSDTWTALEAEQKPREIRAAIIADALATDLINKTLAQKPQQG